MKIFSHSIFFSVLLVSIFILIFNANCQSIVSLENDFFRVEVNTQTGVISSLLVKRNNCDLVAEKRLASSFRINLQLKDNLANYIDGELQKAKSVTQKGDVIIVNYSGMKSALSSYPIDLTYTITLKSDQLSFRSKLTNNDKNPISEFWFPRIGGMKDFGHHREASLAVPTYNTECSHNLNLFRDFPGKRRLGAEAAEFSTDYMYVTMPWWDFYDAISDMGLYLGYHDSICRVSTMHTFLMPDISGSSDSWLTDKQAAGKPVGLVFSHVRYPFIKSGETLESGEFIVHVHQGDWHTGTQIYRQWFMSHFPFDNSNSWLRKKRMWFSSIIYQPEDRIVNDFKGYNQWTKDAKAYGISCHELIGWNNGGLERNYPMYTPEEKIGGNVQFKKLLASIKERGDKCLVFTNYNILDENTAWYKKDLHKYMAQNQYGEQAISMGWGESTLLARKGLDVRYHVRASVVPGLQKILEDQFVQLVKDGAQGFQMDKVISGTSLDFNPMNTLKPDVALCEGLVQAIASLDKKCKAVNPEFEMAAESGIDRFLPYFPVTYRNAKANAIASLRYVFPEWTSAIHVFYPRDFRGVNSAILSGAVVCVEPDEYQGSLNQVIYKELAEYLQETDRIREELNELIFMGKFYDNQGAKIDEIYSRGALLYKVHGHNKTDQRAIVVANNSSNPTKYTWKFTDKEIKQALLYAPFEMVRTVNQGDTLILKSEGLNIIVETLNP